MAAATPRPLPAGYYAPFAVVSDTDHGGWIIVTTALGLSLVLFSTVIRIFVRTHFRQKFGPDDAFLGIATVLAIIQQCIILGAAAQGLGRFADQLRTSAVLDVERSFYASNVFTIMALGSSKCSVALFILRLTPVRAHKQMIYGIFGLTGAWVAAGIFASCLQCNLSHPWRYIGEQCTGIYARILGISIIDALLEVGMFSMVVILVAGLRTAFSNKAAVVVTFSFRLLLLIPIAFRLSTFNDTALTKNWTFAESLYIVWTETQLSFAVISATIPCLRPFITNLSTHYGALGPNELSGSISRSANRSYQLSSMRSAERRKTRQDSTQSETFGLSPAERANNCLTHGTLVSGPDEIHSAGNRISSSANASSGPRGQLDDTKSMESIDSQQIIIKKDVTWVVEHDSIP